MIVENEEKNKFIVLQKLIRERNLSECFIISIDGPCGGGKTTFAESIKREYGYNIVHMDDFYLPFQKRDKTWMNTIAGHMDFKRLIEDVIKPYSEKKATKYISYDCHSDKYLQKIDIDPNKPIVLEGSYSSHPVLDDYVDIKIYIDIDEKTQIERLTKRNEKVVDKFVSMWIPFENNYFHTMEIKDKSDIIYELLQ